MKIGLISDSLRLDFESSIRTAKMLNVSGVQKYMTYGDFSAENMTPERIREIRDIMQSNGLIFSAICGDFGMDLEPDEVVDKSKRVLEKAKELGCDIVTTHIGRIEKVDNPRMEKIRNHAYELATFADQMQSKFACETGTEKASVMKQFLDQLGAKGLAVNLDPANLVMVAHDNPVEAVYILQDYIVHTHAKDGIVVDRKAGTFLEVPLGTGGVEWGDYLTALHEINYTGYLTVEREVGQNPMADIGNAVLFLREKLNTLGIPLESGN